jgi:sulfur carrier protein
VTHAAQATSLTIRVNGAPRGLPEGASVGVLVEQLGLERRRIAVAVNRVVVPRGRFGSHRLHAGDQVEILEAVGGG